MLVEIYLYHFLYFLFKAYFKLMSYYYVIVQTPKCTLQIFRLITSDITIKPKQSITKIFLKRWWWCWWVLLLNRWPTEYVRPYFQLGPLSEMVTTANFQHAVSRIVLAQNLRSLSLERRCTEMISTTPSCPSTMALQYTSKNISPCFSSGSYRCYYSFRRVKN